MDAQYPFLSPCLELRHGPPDARLLKKLLSEIHIPDEDVSSLSLVDEHHPYGRRVFFQSADIEMMLATWTRGFPCSPHDHGGSVGAVRILRGRGRHLIWRVHEGALILVKQEMLEAGQLLSFESDLIHSMEDDGGPEHLMTLHIYADPIRHMVVYDPEGQRTFVVDGACGAWIPVDNPELIRQSLPGIHPASALL